MLYFLQSERLHGWYFLIAWQLGDAISQDIAQSVGQTAQGCWDLRRRQVLWLSRSVLRRLTPFFRPETGPDGGSVSDLNVYEVSYSSLTSGIGPTTRCVSMISSKRVRESHWVGT